MRHGRDGRRLDIPTNEETLLDMPAGGRIHLGVVYPESYAVGICNLGLHRLVELAAKHEDIMVDRIFLHRGRPPSSCALQRPAGDFDILAFSVPYELNLLGVVALLKASGIAARRSKRSPDAPVLLAGGLAPTANPEPASVIFDAIALGDAEILMPQVLDLARQGHGKERFLEDLAAIPGIYVPSVEGSFDPDAHEIARLADLNSDPAHSIYLSPQSALGNLFLVEVMRGCPMHCRFCMLGHVFSPVRLVSSEQVLNTVRTFRELIERVGLVGANVARHPQIRDICRELLDLGLGISSSSLEVEAADEELLQLLAKGGQQTLTLAPEAGSPELRRHLGKNISDEQIISSAAAAASLGFRQLKLYFILGCPDGWDDAEIDEIANLVDKVADAVLSTAESRCEVIVSARPFVPKPQTPWASYDPPTEAISSRWIRDLRRAARSGRGWRLHPVSTFEAALDAMISMGNEQIGELLVDSEGKQTKSFWRPHLPTGDNEWM